MQPVESLQAFSALVCQARREHAPVTTNCFLLADDLRCIIAQKRLYSLPLSCGAAFPADEGAFYRLYYFMRIGSTPAWQALHKPVVLETLYREGAKPAAVQAVEDVWQECGFTPRRVLRHMQLRTAHIATELGGRLRREEERLHQGGLRLAPVVPEQLDSAKTLWKQYLDPYGFTYQSDEELLSAAAQQRLWCVLDASHTMQAAAQLTLNPIGATVQHVVVREGMRRLGLGTALVLRCLSSALGLGAAVCSSWIDTRNTPSMDLFRSLGFGASGRMSAQFLHTQTKGA